VTAKRFTGTKAGKAVTSLLALGLLAVALQSVAFSSAAYTAGSANPANVFVAGTLSHTNSAEGQVLLDASLLQPGESRSATVDITGAGTVTGVYTIGRVSLVDTPAAPAVSEALALRVEDVTGAAVTLYDGAASDFTTVAAGSIAPGETRTYRLTVTYPAASADPALQGASMALRLQVTGVTP